MRFVISLIQTHTSRKYLRQKLENIGVFLNNLDKKIPQKSPQIIPGWPNFCISVHAQPISSQGNYLDPLKHEICVHSDYQRPIGSRKIWNHPFLLKNPQILSNWRSSSTGAKSARIWVKRKVRGVLKTSGKIWNVGVKLYLHIPMFQGDNWGQSWRILVFFE